MRGFQKGITLNCRPHRSVGKVISDRSDNKVSKVHVPRHKMLDVSPDFGFDLCTWLLTWLLDLIWLGLLLDSFNLFPSLLWWFGNFAGYHKGAIYVCHSPSGRLGLCAKFNSGRRRCYSSGHHLRALKGGSIAMCLHLCSFVVHCSCGCNANRVCGDSR